jgi:hypothetical protein
MAIKFSAKEQPKPSTGKAAKAAPAADLKPAGEDTDTDLFKEGAESAPRKGRKKK